MLDRKLYADIQKRYGRAGSWALWEAAGNGVKSNIGSVSHLDITLNPSIHEKVNTRVIMVALNFSRSVEIEKPFLNFHDSDSRSQDFKLRYAFEGTVFSGAYMTDLIKDFPMLKSSDVEKYLKNNPSVIEAQLKEFHQELDFIGAQNPIILAFGSMVYKILSKHLDPNRYDKMFKLIHYSHYISKERYREHILSVVSEIGSTQRQLD